MQLTDNVVLILISCLGVVQAILLCIYLFSLRNKKANVFLALMLLGLIMRIGKSIFNNYMWLEPGVRMLGISGLLLVGPFLWFYGKALFEKTEFSNRNYLQLVPFAVFVSLAFVLPNRGDFISYFIYSLVLAHAGIYLIICWWYSIKKIKGERLRRWYITIVAGVTGIWFTYVGIFSGFIAVYIFGAVLFAFLIYAFSYLLLKRHVFSLEKYSGSTVDSAASKELLQKITDLLEVQEIYLDRSLSVKTVAEKLSVNPRAVSQVINENAKMNFPEFVNQYRITKAQKLLADPRYAHEKIESIAYDCGFGNVTSFNLAFKSATKLTPSQYRSQFVLV
jgi:AraC-like DNA-binding protein